MTRSVLGTGLMGLVTLLMLVPAWGCKVPVFRYALERWEADPYRAVITHGGDGGKSEAEAAASKLRGAGANIEVEVIDLLALTEDQQWSYPDLPEKTEEGWLQLYFPYESGISEPLWSGALSGESVARVLDSPVREAVVEALLRGASTVWVLLESGDADLDEKTAGRLRTLLDQAEETLELPEGVVRAEEVGPGVRDAEGAPLDMDDVLRTSIPLRIDFPMVRLGAGDPEEAVFRAMLLGAGGDRWSGEGPVAVPVFGRGRALSGLPASQIHEAAIGAACSYLCGECSCQVKDQNPGLDLLLAVNWQEKLQGSLVMLERPLPALSGFVAAAEPEQNAGVEGDRGGAGGAMVPEGPRGAAPPPDAGIRLPRAIVWTMGGLLAAALVGTYLMMRRSSG